MMPEKKKVTLPYNNLRLGFCECKDCKYNIRVILTEFHLSSGRVVCICESCLDKASANIKRYKRSLKQQEKCDIIKVEECQDGDN